MNETRLCSLEQLKAFLDGTAGVQFRPFEGDGEKRPTKKGSPCGRI
ncbi:MAG: hypothetical protein ACREJ6_07950 [Candidatus Methylomirabilis sp.]